MNRLSPARRRFRVVARPQARKRRARLFGAACAVLILGAVAVAAARHAASELTRARFSLPLAGSAAPDAAVVDGAEPFRSLAQAAADAAGGSAGEKAAALKAKFPCVADVSVRRAWGEKRSTLTPLLRRAVAPALRLGRPVGFLGDDGATFAAPQGVYAFSGPSVDVADADAAERKALAHEWPALSAAGAFPAPLSQLAFVSGGGEDSYWEARLTDGTSVAWGRLDWTKEKLARLAEALADARGKAPGSFAADLRWFEDGKVLLKPTGLKPAGPALLAGAGAHGGVK